MDRVYLGGDPDTCFLDQGGAAVERADLVGKTARVVLVGDAELCLDFSDSCPACRGRGIGRDWFCPICRGTGLLVHVGGEL